MLRNFRRQRILCDRTIPFDIYDDVELFASFRFRREDLALRNLSEQAPVCLVFIKIDLEQK